ncbi:hypothetical protein FRT59_06370 [Pseudomonas haemolytica]|uniref:Uncharacterized protein n=1 Tax=Pseudomonas haemolytica TaxID=2600065 RepID=A0A5P1D839_9PSED|nr:hypothetical protein [Pseudomonas haemolytica]
MWEGACSRWQWVSQCICKLIHRHREQAPSHIGYSVYPRFGSPCGRVFEAGFLEIVFPDLVG